MGMNTKGGQDWWLLCSTTPLIWNQIMYTSPTHCEDRVSGFPFENIMSEADSVLSMKGRGKEDRDVGCPRRELPVVDPASSVKYPHSLSLSGLYTSFHFY